MILMVNTNVLSLQNNVRLHIIKGQIQKYTVLSLVTVAEVE